MTFLLYFIRLLLEVIFVEKKWIQPISRGKFSTWIHTSVDRHYQLHLPSSELTLVLRTPIPHWSTRLSALRTISVVLETGAWSWDLMIISRICLYSDIENHWSIIRLEWMIAEANFLSCVVTGNGYLENLVSEMAGLVVRIY